MITIEANIILSERKSFNQIVGFQSALSLVIFKHLTKILFVRSSFIVFTHLWIVDDTQTDTCDSGETWLLSVSALQLHKLQLEIVSPKQLLGKRIQLAIYKTIWMQCYVSTMQCFTFHCFECYKCPKEWNKRVLEYKSRTSN